MRIPHSLLMVSMVLVFQACQLSDQESDHVAFGIREDIVLQLKQRLSPQGSNLSFVFQSASSFNCEGAGFEYQSTLSGSQVEIRLISPDVPDPCTGGSAPATEEIAMPSVHGIYHISLFTGDLIENTGILTIDYKGFRLNMNAQDGISIPYSTMLRVPQGLIWGYIYNADQQTFAVQKFNQNLSPFVDTPTLEAGHYGPFYAISPEQISLALPSERLSAKPFVFRFTGDPATLIQSIHNVQASLPLGTEVRVFDWRGFEY